jgi:hypothetical protein
MSTTEGHVRVLSRFEKKDIPVDRVRGLVLVSKAVTWGIALSVAWH